MKQPFAIVLCALLAALSLAGCNSNEQTSSSAPESSLPSQVESIPEESSEQESASSQEEVTVDNILLAIQTAFGDDYPADGEIPAEILETEFGLTSDLYEDVKGEMAMISVRNDRVVVVKAAPGKADAVEQALLDARQKKIDDTMQYPSNIPKTNAAKVVRNGDFVVFLLIGVPSDNEVDIESDEAKQYAEDQVQIAVDAFNSMFTE